MVWDLKDDEWLKAIGAAPQPPNDLQTLLADDLWAGAFTMWANDLGYVQGDYAPGTLQRVLVEVGWGADGETVYAQYVDPSSGTTVQWPEALLARYARVTSGMDEDYSGALEETQRVATEMLEPYVAPFCADVHELQLDNPTEPRPLARAEFKYDLATVDRINQMELKNLGGFDKTQDWDESEIKFYARENIALIGDNHPASYYDYLNEVGYSYGRLFMKRRGKGFSAGVILASFLNVIEPGGVDPGVRALPNQPEVTEAVEQAIARVSKKEVRWT